MAKAAASSGVAYQPANTSPSRCGIGQARVQDALRLQHRCVCDGVAREGHSARVRIVGGREQRLRSRLGLGGFVRWSEWSRATRTGRRSLPRRRREWPPITDTVVTMAATSTAAEMNVTRRRRRRTRGDTRGVRAPFCVESVTALYPGDRWAPSSDMRLSAIVRRRSWEAGKRRGGELHWCEPLAGPDRTLSSPSAKAIATLSVMTTLVLTVVGDDRQGLVAAVADVVPPTAATGRTASSPSWPAPSRASSRSPSRLIGSMSSAPHWPSWTASSRSPRTPATPHRDGGST